MESVSAEEGKYASQSQCFYNSCLNFKSALNPWRKKQIRNCSQNCWIWLWLMYCILLLRGLWLMFIVICSLWFSYSQCICIFFTANFLTTCLLFIKKVRIFHHKWHFLAKYAYHCPIVIKNVTSNR